MCIAVVSDLLSSVPVVLLFCLTRLLFTLSVCSRSRILRRLVV